MLSASKKPMQDFTGDLRYRQQKVWRKADAPSPQEMNRIAVNCHHWCRNHLTIRHPLPSVSHHISFKDLNKEIMRNIFKAFVIAGFILMLVENASPAADQPDSRAVGQSLVTLDIWSRRKGSVLGYVTKGALVKEQCSKAKNIGCANISAGMLIYHNYKYTFIPNVHEVLPFQLRNLVHVALLAPPWMPWPLLPDPLS
eukprot:1161664-Pelagomonas_calceolata.AAC.8